MRKTPEKFGDALDVSGLNQLVRSSRVLGCSSVSSEEGYRHTVKLPVKSQESEPPLVGMYDPGTHEITTGPCYPEQAETINQVLSFFPELLNEFEILPFCQESKQGNLRYIFIRQSSSTGGLQFIFVVYDDSQKVKIRKLCEHLKLEGFPVVSVFLDLQTTAGNEIFAYDFVKVMGKEFLSDSMGGIQFKIKPGSFFQANPKGAAKIYRRIQALVGPGGGKGAMDLYCGAGPIALHLAQVGYKVLGVEEVEEAVVSAKENKQVNSFQQPAWFLCRDVKDFLRGGLDSDTREFFSRESSEAGIISSSEAWQEISWITLNPSRKGLGEEVCASIAEHVPAHVRFVYMSCDASSLARDLKQLGAEGIEVKQLEAFDLFPGTDHLEWVAVLERKVV